MRPDPLSKTREPLCNLGSITVRVLGIGLHGLRQGVGRALVSTCKTLMLRSSSPLAGPMSIGPSANLFGGGAPPESPAGRLVAMIDRSLHYLQCLHVYHSQHGRGFMRKSHDYSQLRKENGSIQTSSTFFVFRSATSKPFRERSFV